MFAEIIKNKKRCEQIDESAVTKLAIFRELVMAHHKTTVSENSREMQMIDMKRKIDEEEKQMSDHHLYLRNHEYIIASHAIVAGSP